MSGSKSLTLAYLILAAFSALVSLLLFEMLSQYIFGAKYEVRIDDLTLRESVAFEHRIRQWEDKSRPVEIAVLPEPPLQAEDRVQLRVIFERIEQGFSSANDLVSYMNAGSQVGGVTISRNPDPNGRMLAVLLSVLLFLVCLRNILKNEAPTIRATE